MPEAVRTEQPKTVARTASILFIARDDIDHTVTIAINGARWEYWLNPQTCDTTEYLFRHISAGKALAYAKSKAAKEVRL